MKRASESDDVLLADRLVNYADAITALAFLGVSGFGVLIADPDARCSIAGAHAPIIVGLLASSALFSALVVVLRRWSLALRDDEPMSPRAARYHGYLHVSRLVVIWLSAALSILLLVAAGDPECDEPENEPAPQQAVTLAVGGRA